MNEKLKELYESKWNDLILNAKDTKATYPLLVKVNEEYQNADIRVMIVGQETDGWCGVLEEHKKDILSVQETYFNYLYKSKDKNRRPFWNRKNFKYFQEELNKRLSFKKLAFIWNNVSKIGKISRGKPTEKIKNLEKQYFNVFEDELKILKPDIIIFTIGNRKIPVEHEKNKILAEMPIYEIKFINYKNIIAISTYHPNARIKGGKKKFNEEIVNFIVSRYKI
jgi:ribosomal protein S18